MRKRARWIRSLYEEKLVSAQCASGNGAGLIPQICEIPSGFVRHELGLSPSSGPSIIATMRTLARDNERRAAMVRARGGKYFDEGVDIIVPPDVTVPAPRVRRFTTKQYQKAAQRVLNQLKHGVL